MPCINERLPISGDNISAVVTFDPCNIKGVPEMKFLGSEENVEELQLKMSKNIEAWDLNGTLADEILKLLGKLKKHQFPMFALTFL